MQSLLALPSVLYACSIFTAVLALFSQITSQLPALGKLRLHPRLVHPFCRHSMKSAAAPGLSASRSPSCDGNHLLALQLHVHWRGPVCRAGIAELAALVVAPRPTLTLLCNRQAVAATSCDGNHFFALQLHLHWRVTACRAAIAELAAAVVAPRPALTSLYNR